jgi:hypothetical protein
MKMSKEDSIMGHINNFKSIFEQLTTIGILVSSNDENAITLLGTMVT